MSIIHNCIFNILVGEMRISYRISLNQFSQTNISYTSLNSSLSTSGTKPQIFLAMWNHPCLTHSSYMMCVQLYQSGCCFTSIASTSPKQLASSCNQNSGLLENMLLLFSPFTRLVPIPCTIKWMKESVCPSTRPQTAF
jgi:hypothetical protein